MDLHLESFYLLLSLWEVLHSALTLCHSANRRTRNEHAQRDEHGFWQRPGGLFASLLAAHADFVDDRRQWRRFRRQPSIAQGRRDHRLDRSGQSLRAWPSGRSPESREENARRTSLRAAVESTENIRSKLGEERA